MITEEKIDIYKHFDGDGEAWSQFNAPSETSVMDDDDWFIIDGLLQDLHLIRTGLASNTFVKVVDERLKELCADDSTIIALKQIS